MIRLRGIVRNSQRTDRFDDDDDNVIVTILSAPLTLPPGLVEQAVDAAFKLVHAHDLRSTAMFGLSRARDCVWHLDSESNFSIAVRYAAFVLKHVLLRMLFVRERVGFVFGYKACKDDARCEKE